MRPHERWGAWLAAALLVFLLGPLLWSTRGWSSLDLRSWIEARELARWADPGQGGLLGLQFAPDAATRPWGVGVDGAGWLAGWVASFERILWTGLFGGRGAQVFEMHGPALAYQLTAWLLVACAAAAAGIWLQRLLLPWVGSSHAQAAGVALALFAFAHPTSVVLANSAHRLGALLALVFGCAAGALYLIGRQERSSTRSLAALVCACIAGGLHPSSAVLAVWIAASEFSSARRYRPARERWRTALSAGAVYLLATSWDAVLHQIASVEVPAVAPLALPQTLEAWSAALATLAPVWLVSLAPADYSAGLELGAAACGAAALLALRPAFDAARSAPRLWARLIGLALVFLAPALLAGSLLAAPSASVDPGRAPWASLALCAALASAATALSGRARIVFPALVALLLACAATAEVGRHLRSAARTQELFDSLEHTRTLYGDDAVYVVVDAPSDGRGAPPPAADVEALAGVARGSSRPRVLALPREGLLAWMRESEFHAQRRAQSVVVIAPRASLEAPPASAPARARSDYMSFQLARPREGGPEIGLPSIWRGDSRSPDLSIDPLAAGALRMTRAAGERGAADELLGCALRWRASEGRLASGGLSGAAEPGPAADEALRFDLSDSLAWRLGQEIRRVWTEPALAGFERGEFLPELGAAGALGFACEREDFVLRPPAGAADARQFEFELVALHTLRYRRWSASPAQLERGALRIEGAAAVMRAWSAGGEPVAWSLCVRRGPAESPRASQRWRARFGAAEAGSVEMP